MNNDLRERPPRTLSLLTRIQVLFGGFYFQFGSIFFWFGLIFVLLFVGQSNVVYWFKFDGDWVETQGMIQSIEETNSEVNESPVYEYSFSFNVGGQSYQGVSYSTWNSSIVEGKETAIEYKEGDANRARIMNTTEAMFPSWIAFVLLFPIVGFFLVWSGLNKNIQALHLLVHGNFTRGKMLSYNATGVEINEAPVYEYEFEFETNYKTYIATCRTHHTQAVEDEELEKILYKKDDPTYSIVYDAIESMPSIDKFGQIEQAGMTALIYLISTILGVLINGAIFLGMYG